MRTHRHGLSRVITMLVVVAAALGAAAPAQASDASLRKAIRAQEKKVDVVADDFVDVAGGVESAVGRERARTAVTKFKAAVARLRTTVAKERATTARVKRGRTQYLAAISSLRAGLTTFDQGLEAFDPDAPAKAAQLFKRSAAQLKSAVAKRDKAAKLIGGLPAG